MTLSILSWCMLFCSGSTVCIAFYRATRYETDVKAYTVKPDTGSVLTCVNRASLQGTSRWMSRWSPRKVRHWHAIWARYPPIAGFILRTARSPCMGCSNNKRYNKCRASALKWMRSGDRNLYYRSLYQKMLNQVDR